ncbi:MAG: GguC protein, partial [Pedosphaera sp.]|nr:GguC protein [Pedosphaera sp.]
PRHGRRVAVANDSQLRIIQPYGSIYALAQAALASGKSLSDTISASLSTETLDYDPIHRGESDWHFLPAFDHPSEPARCLVTGTGLTHKASAENRQAMHAGEKKAAAVTDSMRMYQWGVEGGRPASGQIGAAPEWFYKGSGTILRAHNEPLEVPAHGHDGGEEAEVAGAYVIDSSGKPRRIGLVLSNEFSDHVLEQKNYLYLAHSKLRTCAIGPELIVDADFTNARGRTTIERKGQPIWTEQFFTGEINMSHSLENLEHHHFKYAAHCRPGDAHIHFLGADVFSFGSGIALEDGDIMQIELSGFGKPLRNPIKLDRSTPQHVKIEQL